MPDQANVEVISLPGGGGISIHIYDPDIVGAVMDGPPTVVIGTATCTIFTATGLPLRVALGSDAAMARLGIDAARCLRLTDPQSGLIIHIMHPNLIAAVVGGADGSIVLIPGMGALRTREQPKDVMTAVDEWALVRRAEKP